MTKKTKIILFAIVMGTAIGGLSLAGLAKAQNGGYQGLIAAPAPTNERAATRSAPAPNTGYAGVTSWQAPAASTPKQRANTAVNLTTPDTAQMNMQDEEVIKEQRRQQLMQRRQADLKQKQAEYQAKKIEKEKAKQAAKQAERGFGASTTVAPAQPATRKR